LCMLRVVFPSKTLVFTLHTLFLLFPPGTETGVSTAVEGSFALCLVLQVPPNPHYTPALQLS
jgi:hypothetical protein